MVHLIMNVGFNTFNYNCTQLRGFIQIDKTRRGVFTKIFCFKGCRDPDSTVKAYVGNIRSSYIGRMIDWGAKKWTKS